MSLPLSIPAVERCMRVVEQVATGAGPHTVASLARGLRIPQTTCLRLVQTLLDGHWLASDGQRRLRLASGLGVVAAALAAPRRLVAAAEPVLRALTAATGISTKLVTREADDQVTLHRQEAQAALTATSPVGARYPVVQGASGAALLADLSEADVEQLIARVAPGAWSRHSTPKLLRQRRAQCRTHGVCFNVGLGGPIETAAAPVRGPDGAVVAAVTYLALSGRLTADRDHADARRLRAAARRITAALNAS